MLQSRILGMMALILGAGAVLAAHQGWAKNTVEVASVGIIFGLASVREAVLSLKQ
jgi:hypothetical protein